MRAALADWLGIAAGTVRTQLQRIYAKLPPPRIRSRAGLVARVFREFVRMTMR